MKNLLPLCLLLLSFSLSAQERIDVHLPNSITVSGGQFWFLMEIQSNNSTHPSKIAYVELVNREGMAVQQEIFVITNNRIDNFLTIPSDIPSDNYLIRFYTRISPFIDKEGIASTFITVINPKIPPKNESDPTFAKVSTTTPKANQVVKSNASFMVDLPKPGLKAVSVALANPFLSKEFTEFFDAGIYSFPDQKQLIPEPYGHIVHARIPLSEVDSSKTFFLSSHGTQSVLNSARPDLGGNLYFELGALKDYKYLIAQSSNKDVPLDFSPQSPFLQAKTDKTFPILEVTEANRPFLADLLLANAIQTNFHQKEIQKFMPIVTGFVADHTYLLDDYTRFETVETTLREYVPEVFVRKQARKIIFKVLNTPMKGIFNSNPLLLIDGMPIHDTDKLASFNPQNIYKLEVLTREFSFNKDKFPGVLSFTSYNNDFGGFELPQNALYLNYPPLKEASKFITPHVNQDRGTEFNPDFRALLYWNTNPPSKEQIEIYTSTILGNFLVRFTYIDDNGDWRTMEKSIEVKPE